MTTRRALIAGLLATVATPAFAATYMTVLPRADQQLVDQAAAYLQNLKLAQGRFTQRSPKGQLSAGTLYLSRPGRARFEYDAPAALLVVADGRNVNVFDRRLKSFDRYPLGATPLALFLSRRVRLDNEVMVTRVARFEGGFSLTVKDANKPQDGSLTLDFADAPISLQGWTVVDAQGQQTRVDIAALTPVGALAPALFVLDKPVQPGRP
jgi:outer membrane lipoprotein-sorting protein